MPVESKNRTLMVRYDDHQSPREVREQARRLRRRRTPAERNLWTLLRSRQLADLKFRQQHPIGPFIADFYCRDARLVIEVDGGVHDEADYKAADRLRAAHLRSLGLHVLRVKNRDILDRPDWVVSRIRRATGKRTTGTASPLAPSPVRRGGNELKQLLRAPLFTGEGQPCEALAKQGGVRPRNGPDSEASNPNPAAERGIPQFDNL